MQILPTEFIGQAWNSADKESRAPNITNMIRRSNNVSQWVEATILSASNRRKIVRTAEKFIKVAGVCDENSTESVAVVRRTF
jgi:hypothetical protein